MFLHSGSRSSSSQVSMRAIPNNPTTPASSAHSLQGPGSYHGEATKELANQISGRSLPPPPQVEAAPRHSRSKSS